MGATNTTPLLGLPLFSDDDRPTWRGDINGSHNSIDAGYGTLTGQINDINTGFYGRVASAIQNDSATREQISATWDKHGDLLANVCNYGAVGDGVTDDGPAVAAAISATGRAYFPKKSTPYLINTPVALPNTPSIISSDGATITTSNITVPIFTQANHVLTKIRGIVFDGCSAISFNSATNIHTMHDFDIRDCEFINIVSGVTAISLTGMREGNIVGCGFFSNTGSGVGIYRTLTTNTKIQGCVFSGLAIGINDDGTGAGASAGMHISTTTIIGCGVGVSIVGTYDARLDTCMVDYCDKPIVIKSQTYGAIANTYIGTRSASPCISIGKDATVNTLSQNFNIINCTCVGYVTDPTGDSIAIDEAFNIKVTNCTLSYYMRNGIFLSGSVARSTFEGNGFQPSPNSSSNTCFACTDGTSSNSNRAAYNNVRGTIYTPGTLWALNKNQGYVNEAYGNATITAGSTSVVVTHGMNETPSFITATNASRNIGNVWYGAANATTFTIYCATAPTADTTVSYHAIHSLGAV